MRRRSFLVAAASIPWLRAAHAQAARIPYIGYLSVASRKFEEVRLQVFVEGLRALGYVVGKTIRIEYRFAEGDIARLEQMATDLVQRKVTLIVASSTPPIHAAQKATTSIPIVMGPNADAVAMGFVASLARPGGNITGITSAIPTLAGKQVELAREIIPSITRVALLANPVDPAHTLFIKGVNDAAARFGIQAGVAMAKSPADLDGAFAQLAKERVDVLVVQPIFTVHFRDIATKALALRLPSLAGRREYADAGGLLSYGPTPAEEFRRVATFVDRIVKGARPGDLPVEQPTNLDLVINTRTAKVLGLAIPHPVLLRADNVIE